MKRLVSLLVVFACLAVLGILYYVNLDKNYHALQEFYDFPVPNDAVLESERENAKNYIWEPSTGTEIPLSYQLMIKKSGWKQVKIEGHSSVYEKDGNFISVNVALDYIGILRESNE